METTTAAKSAAKTKTRTYYACHMPYGPMLYGDNSHGIPGRPIRTVYGFASAAERDEWVADGLGSGVANAAEKYERLLRSQLHASELEDALANACGWADGESARREELEMIRRANEEYAAEGWS